MTALPRYELLEAEGRYFDGETARPRDVVVKFGDASLIVLNRTDVPITHWPLASLRKLGDGAGGMTLIPDHGSSERLMIDDDAMIDAITQVCPDLGRRAPVSRNRRRRALIWAVLALTSVYFLFFHIVPAISERMAELIPADAEVAMGEKVVDEIADFFSEDDEAVFCAAPAGKAALAAMTARLEAGADVYLPLTVQVVKHKMVNAFALPGGQIVLFSGLLDAAETPEEVAGVLAHEIGHVAARDPTRLFLRTAGSAGLLGLLLGDFTGAGATVALAEALLHSSYRREAEAAADVYATDMLNSRGLPTAPFADFFMRLEEKEGASAKFFSHLATHPDLSGRAAKTRAADRIGDAPFDPILTDQQWVALKGICGK